MRNILQQHDAATTYSGPAPLVVNQVPRASSSGPVKPFEEIFKEYFPNARVVCDQPFQTFINGLHGYHYDQPRTYTYFTTDKTTQSDTAIIHGLNITHYATQAEIYAAVLFLGSKEGHKFLALPKEATNNEFETNLILGYVKHKNFIWVVFAEHELENEEEEIHLHFRRLDKWNNDCPDGLVDLEQKV